MPLNLASPGIVVKEVDLTNGRVDPSSTLAGGLVAPFAKGPVEEPTLIQTEADLFDTFGSPYKDSNHYEYWYTATSYLAYGGVIRVVRSDEELNENAFAGTASSIRIKSNEDYINKGYAENTVPNVVFASKNPGTWETVLKLLQLTVLLTRFMTGIDTTAVLGFSSTGLGAVAGFEDGLAEIDLSVGLGVTQAVPAGTVVAGAGSTSVLDGYLKGVITEVGAGQVSVKLVSHVSAAGTETKVDYTPGGVYAFQNSGTSSSGLHVHVQSDTGRGWQAGNVSYGSSFGSSAS